MELEGNNSIVLRGLRKVYTSVGMPFFVLIVLIIIFSIVNPLFFTFINGITLLRQACFLALVAAGQMLVVLTSGVDISLGAIIGLCSVVAAIVAVASHDDLPVSLYGDTKAVVVGRTHRCGDDPVVRQTCSRQQQDDFDQ